MHIRDATDRLADWLSLAHVPIPQGVQLKERGNFRAEGPAEQSAGL